MQNLRETEIMPKGSETERFYKEGFNRDGDSFLDGSFLKEEIIGEGKQIKMTESLL